MKGNVRILKGLKGLRKKTSKEDGYVLISITLFSLAFTGLLGILVLSSNLNLKLIQESRKKQAVVVEQDIQMQKAIQAAWESKLSSYQNQLQTQVSRMNTHQIILESNSELEKNRQDFGVSQKQVSLRELP